MVLVLFTVPVFLFPLPARALMRSGSVRSYIQHGGYMLRTARGTVEGLHADTPFIPASTIKLVTSLAALDILGPDYRFETRFYLDTAGNLIIQGDGDPMLTSEEIATIAGELAQKGIARVNDLILDNSAFALERDVDGSEHSERPYDAMIGPTAVNFNAMPIRVHPDGRIDSGEEQTPVLPMMKRIGKLFPPGLYRVNVGAFATEGNLSNESRYTKELFEALLRKQGIKVNGITRLKKHPGKPLLILVHKSDTVRNIVRECLKFSNNFIANELFIACARKRYGLPLTWFKAQRTFNFFIHRTFHPSPGMITMVEGSGLSRKNRITPRMMLKVLDKFSPYADLLPIKHNLFIKSGTLDGVYCYGGYFIHHGYTAPFVIMLNQKTNTRDQILTILKARFNTTHTPNPVTEKMLLIATSGM
jgi:D-alanyl-D-alanine carboxypeptidase/D-alanyl-D-alanine-endopeptidase (penicillin-binding protein 4)